MSTSTTFQILLKNTTELTSKVDPFFKNTEKRSKTMSTREKELNRTKKAFFRKLTCVNGRHTKVLNRLNNL